MRTIAFISIVVMSATRLIGGEIIHSDRSWFAHFTNKVCEFKVKDADVVNAPAWTENLEHPPLSARRAVRLAKATLAAIMTMPAEWKLDAVSLEPWDQEDHWIYIITVRHLTTSHQDGSIFEARTTNVRPATVSIPVLLSGVAIEPSVTLSDKKK
jgi:hypothetical protein